MRKTIIFAAFAALAMLSSCQKEVASEQSSDELTFTASIVDQSTRTTIDTDESSATRGKVSWEVGDEIQVRSGDGRYKAVYYIKSDSDITAEGIATFTYKSGTRLPSGLTASGNYYATYGDYGAITEPQAYSATVGKLPMYGEPDPSMPTRINFTVRCGLLKLKLAASSDASKETISKIEVSGWGMDDYNEDSQDCFTEVFATFTLTCDNELIDSAKDFYIALPIGDYSTIKFTNGSGRICYKTSKNAMSIAGNEIKTLTFTGLTFDDKLPGKFSVAPGKQVQFSKGNLYYDGSDFKFEAAQYATPSDWDETHIAHFRWAANSGSLSDDIATATSTEISLTANEDDVFFTNSDYCTPRADFTVEGKTGIWRSLIGGDDGEWCYMLNERTINGGMGEGHSYQRTTLTLGDEETTVFGLIIAPDGYNGELSGTTSWSDWLAMEPNGCVFLPAAGSRSGEYVQCVDVHGFYWASSIDYLAHRLTFNSSYINPKDSDFAYEGYSVRLVSDTPVYYGNLNGGAANMDWGEDNGNNWK